MSKDGVIYSTIFLGGTSYHSAIFSLMPIYAAIQGANLFSGRGYTDELAFRTIR